MALQTFLNDPISFIIAITGLLSAITGLLKVYADYRKLGSASEAALPRRSALSDAFKNPVLSLSLVVLVASIGIFLARSFLPQLPLHAELSSIAWKALGKSDYGLAISSASECVDTFGGEALRQQQTLLENDTNPPPVGKVSSAERESIFANAVLNDVGTCYYILGQAFEKTDHMNEARDAYTRAQELTYARTWDLRGWFWSPANSAGDRLAQLP
jgi:hypothetical protein